jgi:hypothetical protein
MADSVMKRTNFMDGEIVSIPLVFNSGVETSTGFVLPTNARIYPWDMGVIVDTVDSGKTINVGILSSQTGGDADGFIVGLSLTTAGLIWPIQTITAGTQMTYISANTLGVLFMGGTYAQFNGANVTGIVPPVPLYKPYMCDGLAKTISYTCTTGSTTFTGRLVFRVRVWPV